MDNGAGSLVNTIVYDGKTNPAATQAYINNLKTGTTYKFQVFSLIRTI